MTDELHEAYKKLVETQKEMIESLESQVEILTEMNNLANVIIEELKKEGIIRGL